MKIWRNVCENGAERPRRTGKRTHRPYTGYAGCAITVRIPVNFLRMANRDRKLVVRNALTSMGEKWFPRPSKFSVDLMKKL